MDRRIDGQIDGFPGGSTAFLYYLIYVCCLLKKGQTVNKIDISQLEISDEIDEVCISSWITSLILIEFVHFVLKKT